MNERVECAETLPSRFYIDPTVLTLEKERIFRRTWQLVGTLSQPCGEAGGKKRAIADPGAFFTVDVVGEPVVVVRESAGTLRNAASFPDSSNLASALKHDSPRGMT